MSRPNQINERIRQFVLTNFSAARKQSNFDDDTSLIDRGIIDSMGILELVNFIEQEFEIDVADEDLDPENFSSINNVASFVQIKLA